MACGQDLAVPGLPVLAAACAAGIGLRRTPTGTERRGRGIRRRHAVIGGRLLAHVGQSLSLRRLAQPPVRRRGVARPHRPGGGQRDAAVSCGTDLDHFKQINDRCSHKAGDRVLVEVGAAADAPGFAVRLGCEEFLLVVTGLGRAETPSLPGAVAPRRGRPAVVGVTEPLPVTISVGAAAVAPSVSQPTLPALADAQLYEAMRAGRKRVRIRAARR
jgi:diguanylate cyclase (GGDEF)-like protein